MRLGPGGFDTIVCLNVLEHVEHDEVAMSSFRQLLMPGGHLALLVPAFPWLFGTLDLNGPHFRRYTRRGLSGLIQQSGFELLEIRYFNLFGMPGWWFCGKILKRPILPASGLGWYEKLVPVFRRIEAWTGPPMGLSLIAIARRPEEGPEPEMPLMA
jgi:SAM-dependent methyltransferase